MLVLRARSRYRVEALRRRWAADVLQWVVEAWRRPCADEKHQL